MKYINTLCINCEMSVSGKEIATLNSSHVIRMDQSNYHAYCVFISLFGELKSNPTMYTSFAPS